MDKEKVAIHNDFSQSQYDFMYSDTNFVKFVNTFFSTYLITTQSMSAELISEEYAEDNYFLIRIILANLSCLINTLDELENNLSYSYGKTEKEYQGMIKGALNVNKYVQEIAKKSIPKKYSCVVKEKTYCNPENVYIVYILQNVLEWLESFENIIKSIPFTNKEKSLELGEIEKQKRLIKGLLNKHYFIQCRKVVEGIRRINNKSFPKEQLELVKRREKSGKIRNEKLYKQIFAWYNKYNNANALCEISPDTIHILRYSSEKFADRMFELWNLYQIKETFVNECNCTVQEEHGISVSKDECKFVLRTFKGDIIKLHYQKGLGLYWDEEFERSWRYVDNGEEHGLRGIPDISIELISDDRLLVMVDVKNRIKERRKSSEEIYKMIGYYTNFQMMLERNYSTQLQRRAALIVRNDFNAIEEDLEDAGGIHHLKLLSVSPINDDTLNKKQFGKLCSYVLNSKGIDGTLSSVISSYSKDIQEDVAEDEGDAEDRAYKITIKNHEFIEALFNDQSLQEKLEQYKIELSKNYFPHIWDKMADDVKKILSMAECLYAGMTNCEGVDCAPICLEYCRALEVQINQQILRPFRDSNDIDALARRNRFYEKMKEERDMTLGECMYFFEKCNHNRFPMTEFKNYIINELHNGSRFIDEGVELIRTINEQIRRRSAHTEVLGYADLILARQRILGIGFERLFYLLLDER